MQLCVVELLGELSSAWMILPDAPLTCNTPAAAPLETKKTILAKSYITEHDIIALGSRFFETINMVDVLLWLNLFLKRVSAALLKDTPEMKYKRLVLAKFSMYN